MILFMMFGDGRPRGVAPMIRVVIYVVSWRADVLLTDSRGISI